MPDGPNPGQSYEAFIEGKAGASPPEPEDLDVTVPCVRRKHEWREDTWDEDTEVCKHCGLNRGVFRGSARNEPA